MAIVTISGRNLGNDVVNLYDNPNNRGLSKKLVLRERGLIRQIMKSLFKMSQVLKSQRK